MARGLATLLLSMALLAFPFIPTYAQVPPAKSPDPAKVPEQAKPKLVLDKLKAPPGGVIIVVDNPKDAVGSEPNMILMSPDAYKKLLDTKEQLDKLLRFDKKTAHVCKLSGRLEGDFVLLRALFAFTTEQPRTTVVLGLQGGHLTDEGDLDGQLPLIDFGDEGFLVRVDKEGTHQLTLNLKVPVGFKRPATAGGASERGFELGLPGAAVTTLALDLPVGVKEVRWNDTPEKPRLPNHWELALGKIKTLSLAWKEPVPNSGNALFLSADSQITVKLEETYVLVSADMTLEDPRAQVKEWQLLLPPNAKVDIKAPTGPGIEVLYPEGNRPHYSVRLAEPSADRLMLNVQVRYPRPFSTPRLPIGPFLVLGTNRQEATITVLAPPEALRGQRLFYHRYGDIYSRALPKGPAGIDVAAVFHVWSPGPARAPKGSASKAALELELKADKGIADAGVEHVLNMKPAGRGWLLDVATTIRMKGKPDFLDLQLPSFRIPRFGLLGVSSGVSFPAVLSWLPIAPPSGKTIPQAVPLDFTCDDDGVRLGPPDARRRARLSWSRFPGDDVKLTGKYLVPAGIERVRVDLPRPVDILDRGRHKVTVKVNDQLELLVGAAGALGPVPNKHEVTADWDTFPEVVDFAWKPYRPEFLVSGLTDITLHERSAEVKQQIDFIVPQPVRALAATPVMPGSLQFRVPAAIKELSVTGGKLILHDAAKESAWVRADAEPGTKAEIVIHYDFSLPKKAADAQKGGSRLVNVPLIWPEGVTRQDAKVRIWTETGTKPVLADAPAGTESWKDHGIEIVPDMDILPALVVHGSGINLPLSLRLVEPSQSRLAPMVCERGLIQVTIDEEGTHTYRARYLVRKFNARHLDLEFPMPAATCLQNVWLDNVKITNWEPLEPVPNIAQIPINPKRYRQPVVLEIDYRLPPSFTESKRFWRTTLHPPQFRGDVFLGRVRWQIGLPYTWIALVPAGHMDYRWGMQGWLLGPEPSVTSADLETWLTGKDAADAAAPVSLAFVRSSQEGVQLLHVSRQLWLLVCSGALLAVGLALYVLPLARPVVWVIAVALGLGLLAVGFLWPGWIPALVFGCQPGLVVLLILLGIQWMLHESYRRQLVFMPGFTRLKGNSSLLRTGVNVTGVSGSGVSGTGVGGARREASTIDSPAPLSGSSLGVPNAAPSKSNNSSKGT